MADPLQPNDSQRLVSLDAYRGFTMLMMASAGFGLAAVAKEYPDSTLWQIVGYQCGHVAWTGCSYWDLIQPSFMFIVGVAMPMSYARRRSRGDSFGKMFRHALFRSTVLVVLAIVLSSNWSDQTNFVFTNVLAQIGLGYLFVFLLLGAGSAVQLLVALAILGGYWWLFFQHPLPGAGVDPAAMGIPEDWQQFPAGLAAHWNKHVNFAGWVDTKFLNLFPRPEPYLFNRGGYQTLNFVPSIATMLFGVLAGTFLCGDARPTRKCNLLLAAGALLLVIGMLLDHTIWPDWLARLVYPNWALGPTTVGADALPFTSRYWTVCPIVKRIWTPTWAIFSTGWTLLLLAGFYWVIDVRQWRRWAFPFVVVGMNSIVMYCMAQLMKPWLKRQLAIHISPNLFDGVYGPIVERVSVLFVLWLICLWLYRQRIFVRI